MLKIRLQRTGRKHEPTFRLVLTDSKNSTKSGRFLEILGSYDPRHKDQASFKADRIKHWMSHGVQLTPTIHNLLINKKIIEGEKINVLPKMSLVPKPVEESVSAEATTDVAPEVVTEDSSAEVSQSETKEEAPVVEEAAAPEIVAEAPVAEETPAEIAPEAPVVEEEKKEAVAE